MEGTGAIPRKNYKKIQCYVEICYGNLENFYGLANTTEGVLSVNFNELWPLTKGPWNLEAVELAAIR